MYGFYSHLFGIWRILPSHQSGNLEFRISTRGYSLLLKKSKTLLSLFLSGLLTLNCSSSLRTQTPPTLRIKGSDTMVPVLQIWAQEFMKSNPGIAVYTEGGGTSTGIDALINNNVDIGAASRPIRPEEVQKMAEKHETVGLSFLVAKDALSIYLNPENPVENLTIDQIRGIFSGHIQNWKDVGGPDSPIHVIIRSPNSGTFLYFREHILQGESYSKDATSLPSQTSVANIIARDPFAIGYGGMAYKGDIKHGHINGIAPTEENVIADKYPITRYLYLYTIDSPSGWTKAFIEWVLGPAGQSVVNQVGYYPIWSPFNQQPSS
ncbi:phosphate ABC transporter substrate-binding protein PstS family protein [candidate division KSB1 bacterium]|nr:phosphate ABC transporter substrate-binding protein PstS family protein [candidate division KSB1 bacterium]